MSVCARIVHGAAGKRSGLVFPAAGSRAAASLSTALTCRRTCCAERLPAGNSTVNDDERGKGWFCQFVAVPGSQWRGGKRRPGGGGAEGTGPLPRAPAPAG